MRFFTFLLFCALIQGLAAQQAANYDDIIAPLDSPAIDFKEYLVQIAWINSPEGAIAASEILNAADRAKNNRKEWMRDIQATVNLNEANLGLSNNTNAGNAFFPRYNFGINLNLYNVFTQKDKNDIGRREIDISRQRLNQQKRAIRAEVLSRYAEFTVARSVLQARRQVEQEAKSTLVLIEQQYRTDEKSFEDFSLATKAFYQAEEGRLRAETELITAQLQLEQVLGLRWEQVQHPQKPL